MPRLWPDREPLNRDIDSSEPNAAEAEAMTRATYEDVLNAPDHKIAEILEGSCS